MEQQKQEKGRLGRIMQKLKIRYRFVVVDDQTCEEKWWVRLSPWVLLIFFGGGAIVIVMLTTLLIAYTPLREYIPGYPDGSERQEIIDNNLKIDSLEIKLAQQQLYVERVSTILNGGVLPDEGMDKDSITNPPSTKELEAASETEKALRKKVDQMENGGFGKSTQTSQALDKGVYFYVPVQGEISSSFNPKKNHLGTDISTTKDAPVKSALDGTVVFAGFTSEGGYEIHIQHRDNLTTVYKHNSVLFKRSGDRVRGGETVALSGDTGSGSKGQHLHFEIWDNGIAVDPEVYVGF